MSDDLERTLTESLDRHARRLGSRPEGHLDAVWSRLDRRRNNRRRNVAAVGSVIVVGAGVTGIMLVGAADDGAAPGDGAPATTAPILSWRCEQPLGSDGTYAYFAKCEPQPFLVTPTTAPPPFDPAVGSTIPAPTLSTVTGPPESTVAGPCEGVTGTVPCPTVAVTTTPPMTIPPEVTTTTVVTSRVEQHYTVVAGDSLSRIADRFGVTMEDLVNYNEWPDGITHVLLPGDLIRIPPNAVVPAGAAGPSHDPNDPADTTATPTSLPLALDVTAAPVGSTPLPRFRCQDPLGTDGTYEYFEWCESLTAGVPDPTIATDPSPPPTTAPSVVVTGPHIDGTIPVTSTVPLPPATTAPPLVSTVEQLYVIRAGDNPTTVANLFGITVDALREANPGVIDTFIVGQVLTIPAGANPVPVTKPG